MSVVQMRQVTPLRNDYTQHHFILIHKNNPYKKVLPLWPVGP